MRKLQLLVSAAGFAAAVLGAGRALGGSDHAPGEPATPAHAVASRAEGVKADALGSTTVSVSADDAIRMLADGNGRFVAGAPARPNQNSPRLCDTFANGQHPYAAVLSCADSRVPVELVFDAGIGDLFVVRVAGNVADLDEAGTLEYAVEHLGINAIVVMGHTKCDVVTAVVEGTRLTKNIEQLVDSIAPAAEQARKSFPHLSGPRLVEKAIRANVNCAAADLLKHSELLRERVASGKLKIVGGVYDLHSGEVDWLEPVPAGTVASAEGHAMAPPAAPDASRHEGKREPIRHEPRADARAEEGDDHAAPTTAPVAAAPRKENLPLLGGMLAAGGALSWGISHFVARTRGDRAPKADPAATPVAS